MTDAELVEAVGVVRRFLASRVWDPVLREDVVQDTVEKALRNRHRFDGRNLNGWLCTIAKNTWLSRLRKGRREVLVDPGDAVRASDRRQDLWASDGTADALAALATLSPGRRDAVVAVGYLGMTYDEAGRALGAKGGTVKSRVSRGRDDMAVALRDGAIVPDDVLAALANAWRGVPRSDPYHPVAEALGALYGRHGGGGERVDEAEAAWRELVASGAMDEVEEGGI